TGNMSVIDPDDKNIVWNAAYNRWEITFEARGLAGFFLGTSPQRFVCPGSAVTFHNDLDPIFGAAQWQIDHGNGFINLPETPPYSGTKTRSLTIAPTDPYMNSWKYRCIVGAYTSSPYELRFAADWTGDMDDKWNVPQNWKCGIMPDENTDVIINNNVVHFPLVNTDAVIRSLWLRKAALAAVGTGRILELRPYGGIPPTDDD
ncbi:MAG TPA: hypothetical protein VK907_10010, partial [Phnomibacter sp.]|nr:hypothetical protein [Phnomibacter sp.]